MSKNVHRDSQYLPNSGSNQKSGSRMFSFVKKQNKTKQRGSRNSNLTNNNSKNKDHLIDS